MKAKVCSHNYVVKLTPLQYKKLNSMNLAKEDKFITALHDAGATRVDWSGNLGCNFYFTCEEERVEAIMTHLRYAVR